MLHYCNGVSARALMLLFKMAGFPIMVLSNNEYSQHAYTFQHLMSFRYHQVIFSIFSRYWNSCPPSLLALPTTPHQMLSYKLKPSLFVPVIGLHTVQFGFENWYRLSNIEQRWVSPIRTISETFSFPESILYFKLDKG